MSHPCVCISSLDDALIDTEIVDAVLSMNRISFIETISSCQGTPGMLIDGSGRMGHIAFRHLGGWRKLSEFCLVDLRAKFSEFIDDEIRIDIFCNSDPYAWLNFRNEMIDLVTKRLGELENE